MIQNSLDTRGGLNVSAPQNAHRINETGSFRKSGFKQSVLFSE